MDNELEERCVEYSDGIKSPNHFRGITASKGLAKRISKSVGEPILLSQQVRSLFFILGYDDPSPSANISGPPRMGSSTFHGKIVPLIPEEAKVSIEQFGTKGGKYKPLAYKVPGVEIAVQKLDGSCGLDYTEERFQEALKRV